MKLPPEVDKLLQAYFAGDTSPETIQAMEAWLREDPANPRILAEYGLVDRLIFCEQQTLDTAAIFAALLEAEEAAGPIVVTLPKKTKPTRAKHPHEPLRYKEAFLGLQSIAFDALRQKAGVITAIAAVLALAVVLIVSLSSNSNQPLADSTADESNDPNKPAESALPILRDQTVATLTNTHNAQWDSQPAEDLRRGSKLHPNQRLTLTAGFAEITTARGAVAILQAPATIELLSNDNALRLHTGKLVGQCYTDSSKGFVVQTEHADITDLGTEFGVEVVGQQVTATVFSGVIEVATAEGQTQPLLSNQTARIDAASIEPNLVIEYQAARGFARRLPIQAGEGGTLAVSHVVGNDGISASDLLHGITPTRSTPGSHAYRAIDTLTDGNSSHLTNQLHWMHNLLAPGYLEYDLGVGDGRGFDIQELVLFTCFGADFNEFNIEVLTRKVGSERFVSAGTAISNNTDSVQTRLTVSGLGQAGQGIEAIRINFYDTGSGTNGGALISEVDLIGTAAREQP